MNELSAFYLNNDDGYPNLRHLECGDDPEVGGLVAFVDPSDTLAAVVQAARQHDCPGRGA